MFVHFFFGCFWCLFVFFPVLWMFLMLNCSCVFVEMFLTLTFAWKLQGFPLSKFKIFRVRMMQRNMWCPQSIPQKMPPKTLPASFFVKLIAKARKEKAFSFQVLLLFVSENGYMSQKIDDNIYPYTIHMYITQTMYNLYMYIYILYPYTYVRMFPTTSLFQASNFCSGRLW